MEDKAEYEAWSDVSDGLSLCPKETTQGIAVFQVLTQDGHKTIKDYLDKGNNPKVLHTMLKFRKTQQGIYSGQCNHHERRSPAHGTTLHREATCRRTCPSSAERVI